ncbi:MAG: hypothetical protein SAMD01599839_08900 [Rectinema sp.]|jgi:hypothetical protein
MKKSTQTGKFYQRCRSLCLKYFFRACPMLKFNFRDACAAHMSDAGRDLRHYMTI